MKYFILACFSGALVGAAFSILTGQIYFHVYYGSMILVATILCGFMGVLGSAYSFFTVKKQIKDKQVKPPLPTVQLKPLNMQNVGRRIR